MTPVPDETEAVEAAVRAGIERLIAIWREAAGDEMDMESKTLRQVCNVLEVVLKYAVPAAVCVCGTEESHHPSDHGFVDAAHYFGQADETPSDEASGGLPTTGGESDE